MIKIIVKVHASIRKYLPGVPVREGKLISVPENSTIQNIVDFLNIPPEDTHIVVLNKRRARLHDVVQEGDEVIIFPPIGGG